MIWIFDLSAGSGNLQSFSLYGVTFFSVDFLLSVRDMLIGRFDRNFLTLLRLCEMLMASFLSVPQCLPCVFRLFSSLGCYLRSIPLLCVCWSRLICTFLVEVVRAIPFQHFFYSKAPFETCLLSLLVFFLHLFPQLLPAHSHLYIASCAACWWLRCCMDFALALSV